MADPVVIDTSAWIAYFRGLSPGADAVEELLHDMRAVMCGPVELEIRRGLRHHERGHVLPLLAALPVMATMDDDYSAAGDLLQSLRARGVTLPSLDGLIAALCIRHELELLTLDDHFRHIQDLRRHPLGS